MGSLIFQNKACLVINKLPGESSENFRLEGEGELFPVHRLDTPVSGCLLLARNKKAAAFLGAAFAKPPAGFRTRTRERGSGERLVEKCYWAIVEKPAHAIRPEGEVIHWLGTNKKINKSFVFNWSETPPCLKGQGSLTPLKKAVLRYRIAGEGDHYIFMEIELVTGRHHQIRAQLSALGLHIKGDLKYGARRSEKDGGIRLHAYFLAFPNPLEPGEIIQVKALPPLNSLQRPDPLWTAFTEVLPGKTEND